MRGTAASKLSQNLDLIAGSFVLEIIKIFHVSFYLFVAFGSLIV
jgi:hypothetical protein